MRRPTKRRRVASKSDEAVLTLHGEERYGAPRRRRSATSGHVADRTSGDAWRHECDEAVLLLEPTKRRAGPRQRPGAARRAGVGQN